MKKISKRNKMLLSAAIAFIATATSGVGILSTPRATAETSLSNFGGFISYDASQVTVSDGFSPIVGASTATNESGGGLYYKSGNKSLQTIVRLGAMTRQLDNGHNGLLVKSVQSGASAEGAGFNFTNALDGDFSMDFRVFSQETYQGWLSANTKTNSYADTYNPFLDLKQVGITITSVSNPDKSFTINVHGAYGNVATALNASVAIEGENFKNGVVTGYGIKDGTTITANYNTKLNGTSFTNASEQEYNGHTSLSVDMETLKVYGVSSTMTSVGSGDASAPVITSESVLIRDLWKNETEDGTSLLKDGMSWLNPSDFANGYTVSVEFVDVMSNDTIVEYPSAWSSAGSEAWGNATGTVLKDADGNDLKYDRYANMVIYSLNGQSFQKNSGFSVDTKTDIWAGANNTDKEQWQQGNILRLHTQETGLAAEGVSFDFAGTKTGLFEQEFAVYTTSSAHYVYNWVRARYYGGNGVEDDGNLQPTIREIAFDFVSKSNPEAKFTLYIRSHNSHTSYQMAPAARVAIPGDEIYTVNFEQGYGLKNGTTFQGKYQTELDGCFKGTGTLNTADNNISKIKFDPTEMKVYGVSGSKYILIRDLANNSGSGVPVDYCANLSASDFEQGYNVSFRITDVTRNGLGGWANRQASSAPSTNTCVVSNKDGNLNKENVWTYDFDAETYPTRNPDIWLAGTKTTDIDSLNTSTDVVYDKKAPTAKILPMELGDENELTPVFFGVMSNGATVTGDIAFANGSHTGVISAQDGVYKFVPTEMGEYTFTYNVSWNGETIEYTTKAIAKDLYSTLVFKNGNEVLASAHVENGKTYTLSEIAPQVNLNGYTFVGWTDGEQEYTLTDTITAVSDMEFDVVKAYAEMLGATISLGGEIGVNFYVEVPETASTQKATFSVGGEVVKTVNLADALSEGNVYKLTYTVAPKDFRTEITVTVENATTKTYSAESYLMTVISDTTDTYSEKDKAIANATWDYCSIASKYFDGAETDVTVAELTEDEITAIEAYAHTADLNLPEGVNILGPRLVLESNTSIRLYFASTLDLTNVSCTVNGERTEFKVRTEGGVTAYYVEISDIAAKDLDEMQEVKIGEGEYATISYSALSYVRSAILDFATDAALKEVVTVLYRYNVAANAYFAN